MIIECLTCDKPIIANHGQRRADGTMSITAACHTCGAIFTVEIRELRASQRDAEWIAAHGNHAS